MRVKELLDGARFDKAGLLQIQINLLGQFVVFWAVGVAPVVKGDVKAFQVLLAPGGNVGHELLRGFARFFCGNHDGGPMGIVGTDKVHRVALHALRPHPGVGLDVFHDVANVKVAVGVGQGGGDEELALRHGKER